MADEKKLVKDNVPGDFFVDTTCINCDTCRQLAPSVFRDQGDFSCVQKQPQNDAETIEAMHALLSCPTGSIGNRAKTKPDVVSDFPLPLTENVYYCGFNSPASYGGNSFLITHEEGNWLVDSPKFVSPLVKRLEAMGGIRYIFLSHRDDVADAAKYAEHFGAKRIIHKLELAAQPEAEIVIDEADAVDFQPHFKIIVTPGHTRGHMVLLYKNHVLLSGDHLSWDRERQVLNAHEQHCWYSWPEQIKSLEKLIAYDFDWLLAGHGDRVHLSAAEMKTKLRSLVEAAQSASYGL
jgi:glyoxylase-like metal-dependent hydrolase (beta-lactamase superfamily II)/ferredoxin